MGTVRRRRTAGLIIGSLRGMGIAVFMSVFAACMPSGKFLFSRSHGGD